MSLGAPIPSITKKAIVEAQNVPSYQPTSMVAQALQGILRFGRSLIAEWIVYALVYHSIGAIVTFFLFVPVDLIGALVSNNYEHGRFLRFHVFFFSFPTGNYTWEAFPLGTWILLAGLWTLTVRPSLALAGWVVNKRLPAYTLPAEKYPPIRWSFEYLCCVANHHHVFIPDPEFYARKAMRLINTRVSSDSYQLGTITPDEHDELRTFSHIYNTVMTQYLSKGLPIPTVNTGEGVHSLCADRILSQIEGEMPSSGSLRMQIRWETRFFWKMYVFVQGYWMFRVLGEINALIWPYAEDGTSCVEEWYEKYAIPKDADRR